jgi:6,7-dimethyl-8-ribityllumazine synthase
LSEQGAGTLRVPEGCHAVELRPLAEMAVAVVASRYNADVVQRLLDGAVERLVEHGVSRDRITIVFVPGAWELPLACRRLAEAGGHQAVIALGCVVRGDTPHFEYVCREASRGVSQASLDTGLPVGFGLLTTDNLEQAEERAGGSAGNKGAEAADAAVVMAQLMRALPRGDRRV